MQSGILHRDTIVETRVDVLVITHGPLLRSTSTAHGIVQYRQRQTSFHNHVAITKALLFIVWSSQTTAAKYAWRSSESIFNNNDCSVAESV